MLFNLFHAIVPYISEITVLIINHCLIFPEPSLGLLASDSDKVCAKTMPTQPVEKDLS